MIRKDGIIKTATPTNSPYKDIGSKSTTYGYVYLSSRINGINGAIDFANRNFIQRKQNTGTYKADLQRILVVIRLEMSDDLLKKDKDEESFGDSTCDCCFRYNSNIIISDEVFIAYDFPNYQKCCNYYDGLTDDRVKELNWKKILSE